MKRWEEVDKTVDNCGQEKQKWLIYYVNRGIRIQNGREKAASDARSASGAAWFTGGGYPWIRGVPFCLPHFNLERSSAKIDASAPRASRKPWIYTAFVVGRKRNGSGWIGKNSYTGESKIVRGT